MLQVKQELKQVAMTSQACWRPAGNCGGWSTPWGAATLQKLALLIKDLHTLTEWHERQGSDQMQTLNLQEGSSNGIDQ